MDIVCGHRRSLLLALLVAAMALVLALAPHATGTAEAGPNSGQGTCVKGYNYADEDAGYLFASSEAFSGCSDVTVEIWNEGSVTGGGWGPGFEGSSCMGMSLLAQNWGFSYVSAQVDADPSTWVTPCSFHYAEDFDGWSYSQGGLYFMCKVSGCMQ